MISREMAENSSELPYLTLHKVSGLLVPSVVKKEMLDKLKELELYPDDVWVVTPVGHLTPLHADTSM
jgi:hypothetical protein